MAFSRRYKILSHWLRNKNDVSVKEILWNVFRPVSKTLAIPRIREIGEEGEYYKVCFRDLERPLFYPKEMSLNSLYQVVVELFDEREWHYYEIPETKVSENDIVADCGAAEGLFGLLHYQKCRKLYLIEPLPLFLEALKKTFKGIENVEILPVGLLDKIGTAYIDEKDISSALNYSRHGIKVTTNTLDNLFYEKGREITYLKADLEGSEMEMLKGGYKTIQKYKPKIAITTYHKETDYKEIKNFLQKIVPEYKFKYKGIEERWGRPVMLHAWATGLTKNVWMIKYN